MRWKVRRHPAASLAEKAAIVVSTIHTQLKGSASSNTAQIMVTAVCSSSALVARPSTATAR